MREIPPEQHQKWLSLTEESFSLRCFQVGTTANSEFRFFSKVSHSAGVKTGKNVIRNGKLYYSAVAFIYSISKYSVNNWRVTVWREMLSGTWRLQRKVKVFQPLEAKFLLEKGLEIEKFFVIFKAHSPTINRHLNFWTVAGELGWADIIILHLRNFRDGRNFKGPLMQPLHVKASETERLLLVWGPPASQWQSPQHRPEVCK